MGDKTVELSECRKKIDEINARMLALFLERMELSSEIGRYKIAHGLPVCDPSRESDILAGIAADAGEKWSGAAQAFFREILRLSREEQMRMMGDENNSYVLGKQCFLIGEKLSHSYSAFIHSCWNLYDYSLLPMTADAVPEFLREGKFDGLNVTMPYKQLVIPYCDELSPEARRIGAVNAIVRDKNGRLHGYNTDYFGFAALAHKSNIGFADRKIVIFGGGGTSKTVSAAVQDAGAREVVVVSRHGQVDYGQLPLHYDAEILVNTTPVGMFPDTQEMIANPADFPKCEGVLDVVYNPTQTHFVQAARQCGIPCAGGLWMLVEQARRSAELFAGVSLVPQWTERVVDILAMRI